MKEAGFFKSQRLAVLAVSVLVSIQLTANVLDVPTILDGIGRTLGLQSTSQGVLLSTPVLATAFGALPGGILSERVGMRKATAVGVGLLGSAGLLRGFSQTFLFLLLFTFLVGLGYGLALPNMAKVVSKFFPGELAGTASGIYSGGLSIGAILGLTLSPTLAALTGGWKGVLVVWGLAAIATALVWLMVVEDLGDSGRRADGEMTSGLSSIRRVIRSPGVLTLAGLFFMGNFLFYVETGWLKQFFDWRWSDPATSIVLISMLSVPFLPSNIGIPALSDRIGARKLFLVILGLVSAVAGYCFVFPSQSLAFVLTPLLGITVSAEFSLCLTLPVELVQNRYVGTASGFSASIGYLGGVIGPMMVGALRQDIGGFDFLPQVLAGASLTFVLLSLVIPETGWKAKKAKAFEEEERRQRSAPGP